MKYLLRHLEKEILEASKYFKAILLLGARQVGKSTLLSHLFPEVKTIVFDPIQDPFQARSDPDLFLSSFPSPLILDEVQYAPEVLAALKRKMDLNDKKGQYFLTGSQNFSMLKAISESMAGRVAVFHLDNLTPQEMAGLGKEESWISNYLKDPENFYKGRKHFSALLPETLFRGSFPGTLEIPTDKLFIYFRSYLQTYMDRDVRIQEDIRQLAAFDRFLAVMAQLTAQEINSSQLGRELGISPQTARRWLDLLLFSFQWLEVLPFHGNTIKRLSGKKKGYFKDTGLLCYLARIESLEAVAIHPKLGALFETWVVNMIHKHCDTMPTPPHIYHWRTGGGAEVDLICEKDGKLYPIEIKCKTNLTKGDLRGLKAFRETYIQQEIMPALVVYAGSDIFQLDSQTIAIPWNLL